MLHRSNLHGYQVKAVGHIHQHPQSALFLDPGMGKTISTLTALTDLFNTGQSRGALVVAPLRVCQTVWETESQKWSHTNHLKFSLIHGTVEYRLRSMQQHRHVYLVNYEALPWLSEKLKWRYINRGLLLPFDTIVMDEITKLKSTRMEGLSDPKGSIRGRALMTLLPHIPRRIGLTGTPAPNGLGDLFGQYLVLDDGLRLGKEYATFRERFFQPTDASGYKYVPTKNGKEHIYRMISDITLQMKGEDYLELPKVVENIVSVKLTPKLQAKYDKMELEMFLELDSGAEITAVNTLSLMGKCFQFSAGAIYKNPELPDWERIHDLKLDALQDIYEENGGKPLLVAYQYKHDKERILKKFGKIGAVVMDGSVNVKEAKQMVFDWNMGKIPMLLGHPAAISHGINLQQGSNHVVFFGLNYNLELYLQFLARVARQGQPEDHVFVHKILCQDTLDFAVDEALKGKETTQDDLRSAIGAYRQGKNKD